MDDIKAEFALDPCFLTVNHGSFGATPRRVLAAQAAWRARLEAQPSRFMVEVLPPALRAAAARLAGFLGCDAEGLGFVDNATSACNAVLRSVPLAPGDEVLVLSHAYGAVRKAAAHVAAAAGARVVEAPLPFPRPAPDTVAAAVAHAIGPRTRLAVLDHITSPSALVLPIAAMIAACRASGVPVLVDGAHGPGQVPLALGALGADWYAGNCHKWLMAPKGCAFLWTAPAWQAATHAPILSHGLGEGYLAEFDWTGTRDPSAFLAVTAAIDFLQALGGEALMARNRALALAAGEAVAARLGTGTGALPEMAGSMAVIRLPLPGPATREAAVALRARLLAAGTDAPVSAIGGAFWLRLSAAAYNTHADYERLGNLLTAVLSFDPPRAAPEACGMDLPITGWHAHVYYDPAATKAAAVALREGIAAGFPAAVLGRWHDVPVGPHTAAMYQVAFPPALFPSLVPWLALHRSDLSVLVHPETGRQRADHTRHALWLGPPLPLKAEILPE